MNKAQELIKSVVEGGNPKKALGLKEFGGRFDVDDEEYELAGTIKDLCSTISRMDTDDLINKLYNNRDVQRIFRKIDPSEFVRLLTILNQ